MTASNPASKRHKARPHEGHKTPYTNNEGMPLCWATGCYRRGIFRDWSGWLWCWRHVWRYAQRPLRRGRIGA